MEEGSYYTTKGWKLLVVWKDVTKYCITLKDFSESNPVETSEYADANNLLEEPVFKWWTNKVLKKKDRMIFRVKSR